MNPCRAIKVIKYERKEREGLTAIELEKVRMACKNVREKALVEFLYGTGARVTEACTIKISDVDFEKGEVWLFGKGSKHRKSYITAKCALYLSEYLNSRDDKSEYLFVSERKPHNSLKKEAIERVIRNLGKRSDIGRELFPHLFRHTVATDMLQKSIPVTDVQRMDSDVFIATFNIFNMAETNPVEIILVLYSQRFIMDIFQFPVDYTIHSSIFRAFYDIVNRKDIQSIKHIFLVGCPKGDIPYISILSKMPGNINPIFIFQYNIQHNYVVPYAVIYIINKRFTGGICRDRASAVPISTKKTVHSGFKNLNL